MTNKLYDSGLIKNKVFFELFARLSNFEKSIKSGNYNISRSLSIKEILNTLNTDQNTYLYAIAKDIASSGFADTSRVGGGNPDLGVSMAKYNKKNIEKHGTEHSKTNNVRATMHIMVIQ